MIRLTRLNRVPMVLNSDLIEHIDVTPDTVITLTTGQILRVRESADEVIRRIVEFRRQVFGPNGPLPAPPEEAFAAETGPAAAPLLVLERAAARTVAGTGTEGSGTDPREPRD
jgi:flagellar protein FlbD